MGPCKLHCKIKLLVWSKLPRHRDHTQTMVAIVFKVTHHCHDAKKQASGKAWLELCALKKLGLVLDASTSWHIHCPWYHGRNPLDTYPHTAEPRRTWHATPRPVGSAAR